MKNDKIKKLINEHYVSNCWTLSDDIWRAAWKNQCVGAIIKTPDLVYGIVTTPIKTFVYLKEQETFELKYNDDDVIYNQLSLHHVGIIFDNVIKNLLFKDRKENIENYQFDKNICEEVFKLFENKINEHLKIFELLDITQTLYTEI